MFDGLEYTREALAKELYLIELHAKDGSAFNAHCSCIQEKHLLGIIGLAEEGITLSKDEKERKFYEQLAIKARDLRNSIMQERFEIDAKADGPAELSEHQISECVKECMVDGHTKKECEANCKS